MSAFEKVVLTERENSVTQNNVNIESNSAVQKQVNNFDTDYTNQRLNDLYNEFDAITINDTDLNTQIVAKTQAKQAMSVRTKLYLTAGVIVALLLVFLTIYNIFVINNLKSGINLLQADIATQEVQLTESTNMYEALTNNENIQAELAEKGYVSMDTLNQAQVEIPVATAQTQVNLPSNWWDAFCNFVAGLFGR